MKALALAVLVLLAPFASQLGVAALVNPATAICTPIDASDPGDNTDGGDGVREAETTAVVFPLPAGTWTLTSPFGVRRHPITGTLRFHTGVDLAARDGVPILAVADGTVVRSGPMAGLGNVIIIRHTVAGQTVESVYGHMWDGHLYVSAGDRVVAGQHIGDVGSAGNSTGPHLHLEIHPGGWPGNPVDPHTWLSTHEASTPDQPIVSAGGCPIEDTP